MKLKHISAVTVGAAALCAPSCDLDEKFYSEVTPDTFFTSPESTYAVLCRPFTHWKWYIGADRWYLQELTTDEMVCPKRGSDWYNSGITTPGRPTTASSSIPTTVRPGVFRVPWKPSPTSRGSITTPSGSTTPSRPTTSTS